MRVHHATSFVHVVASASDSELPRTRMVLKQNANASRFLCPASVHNPLAALHLTASFALEHDATHFAFLRQHMWMVKALPLSDLPCPFTTFAVHLTPERVTKVQSSSSPGFNASGDVEHVVSLGFVCVRDAVRHLLSIESFFRQEGTGCADATLLEQRLGAMARYTLGSPPLQCALDGCAPHGENLVTHADEAACHSARVSWRRATPLMLPQAAELRWGNGLQRCAAMTAEDGNQTDKAPLVSGLPVSPHRFVAPPVDSPAHDAIIGLTPEGRVLDGASALDRLASEPPALRRVLIAIHSFDTSPFDYLHSRMLQIPRSRALWIVREAAVLILCNNARMATSYLVARLRSYAQRSRWMLHSPINPGARVENAPGYLCGELASLVQAAPIWSHYAWVVYSNPDVVVTPELWSMLATRLVEEEGKPKPPDFLLDRFSRGYHAKDVRYSMEIVVFRTERIQCAETCRIASPRSPFSIAPPSVSRGKMLGTATVHYGAAFSDLLHLCVAKPRANIPEGLLRDLVEARMLRVQPLKAVRYLTFSAKHNRKMQHGVRKVGAKTFLYPGGVWHNHNASAVEELLRSEEANLLNATPTIPSDEELRHPPYV